MCVETKLIFATSNQIQIFGDTKHRAQINSTGILHLVMGAQHNENISKGIS